MSTTLGYALAISALTLILTWAFSSSAAPEDCIGHHDKNEAEVRYCQSDKDCEPTEFCMPVKDSSVGFCHEQYVIER